MRELDEWRRRYADIEVRLGEVDSHKSHAEHVKRSAAHEKEIYEVRIRDLEDQLSKHRKEIEEWKIRY